MDREVGLRSAGAKCLAPGSRAHRRQLASTPSEALRTAGLAQLTFFVGGWLKHLKAPHKGLAPPLQLSPLFVPTCRQKDTPSGPTSIPLGFLQKA